MGVLRQGLWSRFSDSWLVTNQARKSFLTAVVGVIVLTIVFTMPPDLLKATFGMRLFSAAVGVVGPIAAFFVWFGMWRHWARLDTSSAGWKRFWFVVLIFGLWWGGCVYYYFVYRPAVIRTA